MMKKRKVFYLASVARFSSDGKPYGKWAVYKDYGTQYSKMRQLMDVRTFNTFEEADECAKRIANGEFSSWDKGEYVNMR